MTGCKFAEAMLKKIEDRKSVHIVIEGGCVIDAFADGDIDIIVHDLDCQDPEMRAAVEKDVACLAETYNEVEIY